MTETMGHRAPGLVTSRMNPDLVMMVCTAGHVDHGKTALVKMLTGCMTDRLREEQERGLTIDLGFAPCLLGGNLSVGIVDVPGHEKFIRNMVAGVSGIGMTILVIAADDGVMPQTVEHMQIMTLLGVRRGIIALTKTDLVDSKTREIRIAEIREFVKNTFLKDAPICPVSSKTFEGYDSFYTRFVEEVSHIRREQALGLFRMPVERVFMRQGFGMVLTGIPVAGVVRVGDELELMPGGNRGRVRAIQRFSREAEEGFAGQCLALNLPDMGRMEPRRGQVLCTPGCIEPACIVHTYLTIVPGLHLPLKNAVEIKFHSGTLELHGKIYMLEKSEIASGESGFATIVLAEPAAIAPGDRLIIRRPSPAETVAGGEILVLTRGDRRPSRQIILPRLERRLSMTGRFDPASREGLAGLFEYLLLDEFPQGSSGEALARSALLHMEEARDILDTLLQTGVVRKISAGWVIHRDRWDPLLQEARSTVQSLSARGELSVTQDRIVGRDMPAQLRDALIQHLASSGILRRDRDRLILAGAASRMEESAARLLDRILRHYEDTGFQSPRPDELPEIFRISVAEAMRLVEHLCNEGRLIRLDRKVIVSQSHYKLARDRVIMIIKEKGVLNSGDFKHVISSSRKYALALLDYMDAVGITMRAGNDRKLAPDYEKRL